MNQDPPTEKGLEQTIQALLKDPLLSDVPNLPTEQILDDLIALELGHAYKIRIQRGTLPSLSIVVGQASTVRDIKTLVEKAWAQQEENKHRTVSWKYIWRTYCLEWKKQRLVKDEAMVSQLGLYEDATLGFIRLVHDKQKHRKAWRRSH
ncbi:hypothetical protein BC941DRAFT_166710 [Chlamydoabsidia padenii]|nr:hypothetical protein BC941DRAFT_166710 [Chlamydoabsidia padenii]